MIIKETTYDKSCIYCISNTDTGKVYFGRAKNYTKRAKEHLQGLKRGNYYNEYLQRAFNKEQDLIIFPFEKGKVEDLPEREKYWIKHYSSNQRDNGYNLTEGGIDFKIHSKEQREKIAKKRKGVTTSLKGRKQSEEHKLARSITTKGISKPMSESTLLAVRAERQKRVGTRQKGKPVKVTDTVTGITTIFDSKRAVEDFLNIERDTLIHKFYYGKPRVKLKEISYKQYIIKR